MNKSIRLETSWKNLLSTEFEKEYFLRLQETVRLEYKTKTIYPNPKDIFKAFDLTPVKDVKVVIIGQDPYHGPGQAQGLCFSVPNGIRIPPSLSNIFRELKNDLGINIPEHGDLSSWSRQGVLLLNTVLTVEKGIANSHKGIGWERFTKIAIQLLSDKCSGIVFILWGKQAEHKKTIIDKKKHLILTSVHPSPLSAYNGFFGTKHFSRTNKYLRRNGREEIRWNSINL